jgi:hypothetical protein
MPISNDESVELYQYLLGALERQHLVDIRAVIEVATSVPIVEDDSSEAGFRVQKGVGNTSIRRPTPLEVLETALDVLYRRLVEIPAVAQALSKNLERSPEQIEFRPDTLDRPSRSEPVSLASMSLTEAEHARISELLRTLGAPAKKQQESGQWQPSKS